MTGRMAQADTVVPGGVQGLDRYSYTANNPINFVDPTGHRHRSNYREQIHQKKLFEAEAEAIQTELNQQIATIQDCATGNASAEECQAAIDFVIKYFNIEIPSVEGTDYSDIIFMYQNTDEYNGRTTVENGKIVVRLGRDAFRSLGFLGATLEHEFCHANQMTGPTCNTYRVGGYRAFHKKTTGPRSYECYSQGCYMNEVEAYDLELSKANFFRLTSDEIKYLQDQKNIFYSYLTPDNKWMARSHSYFCVELCNSPVTWKANN
jgi:hypothetical protein